MQQRPMTTPVNWSEMVQVANFKKTRERSKLTWVKVVRKDTNACDLIVDMALDRVEWKNMTCAATPSSWG